VDWARLVRRLAQGRGTTSDFEVVGYRGHAAGDGEFATGNQALKSSTPSPALAAD
jgi:hypothetical protein